MRRYLAVFNSNVAMNGWQFYSRHRAGSKANRDDMLADLASCYGWNHAKYLIDNVISILLSNEE